MIGMMLQQRYSLEIELGRGGVGVVYRAHDALLDRDVAIKVLAASGLGTEGRARLLHEARAAAQLNHPNIVGIYDAGEYDGTAFIIMELVEDESLFSRKPSTLDQVYAIAQQICAALEHAHTNGIVHRDLKPENVIITNDGTVKLTDFGLARSVASRVTNEGVLVGTVFYVPPEQALGKEIDGRADLYALGVMLYELVTGRLPFTADDPLAVVSQHIHAPVVPPSTYNAEIPPTFEALIMQMMSKQPEDRPASAAEVRLALDRLAENRPAASADAPRQRLKPSPLEQLVRGRLVGREHELKEARALWKRAAAATGDRAVLLISGEPGVGKTPFVREIRALAEISGGRTLTGACYSEGSAPYAPVAQIIEEALSVPELDLPDNVLAGLLALAPELENRFSEAPDPPFDPQAERQRLYESVVALCAALTDDAPLLLVVEDVQWADGGTLFLLRHLARRVRSANLRLLIVMTYREEELVGSCCLADVLFDLNRERLATRIKLVRLDREQTRELLTVMLRDEVTSEFVDGIFRETEGNLFFIEEIVRALVEEGKLYRTNGRWHRPAMGDIQLPQSIRMAIQARVSKLPARSQDVLRLAAIVGREFDFATLHEASDLDEDALINALEAAEQAQLIGEVRRTGREAFAFAHGLTMTTLRESVSGLRRRRLHRTVAAAIEALRPDDFDALAFHYEQAGDAPRARVFYVQAGDRALAVYANQAAERYYSAALELTESVQDRGRLLSGLGEVLFRQSRYEQAGEAWHEAIELYHERDDYDNLARLYARAARAAWYTGDVPGGLELCREGMQAMPQGLETPGTATLVHETARACAFNDLPDEALPLCQQALEMSQRLGLVEVQADALATLGILRNQPIEVKIETLKQAVDLAESAGLLSIASRAHLNLGGRLQEHGDLLPARAHYLRSAELARQVGNADWEHDHLCGAAQVSLALGDLRAAEETLAMARQLEDAIPNSDRGATYLHAIEADLLHRRGEWDRAIDLYQSGLVDSWDLDNCKYMVNISAGLAEVLSELDRFDEASRVLTEAIQRSEGRSDDVRMEPLGMLAAVRVSQGHLQEAQRLLDRARGYAGQEHERRAGTFLDWVQARLLAAEGKWDDALTGFEGVSQRAAEMGEIWYRARITTDWANAHLKRGEPGDRTRAQELLRQALAEFRRLQSPGYADWVEDQLLAVTVRDTV